MALVRRSPFPVLVLHGRSDLLAPPKRGAALAARLGGAYVELEGAHFLTRERGPEVNALVRSVVGGDLAGGSSTNIGGAASPSSANLPSLSSVDNDANYCGGWAVPDPHRDLVPKQGWWRHRNNRLRGSMSRLSSALTGAGGSMAALAAHASAAAVAAATAAASASAEREHSSSLSSALSTPLVIDDASAAPSPVRAPSPAPRLLLAPYAPPNTNVINVQHNHDLRYASSPEPWSRERSFDDAREGGCGGGVVEWISLPGDGSNSGSGGSSGSLGANGSGSDDNSGPSVVLKGAALVSPAGSPPPRHRRHNQHLSFMTKRCSTAECGTPPPVSLMRDVVAPTVVATKTTSLFNNSNMRRSPSPSLEPPRTPPHGANNDSSNINSSNGSFAFKHSNLRHHLSSSDEDLRSSEYDERRHGSQCPFVDPVARGVGAIVDSSYDGDE